MVISGEVLLVMVEVVVERERKWWWRELEGRWEGGKGVGNGGGRRSMVMKMVIIIIEREEVGKLGGKIVNKYCYFWDENVMLCFF